MHSMHQSPKLVLQEVQKQLFMEYFDFTHNLYRYICIYISPYVHFKLELLHCLLCFHFTLCKKLKVKFCI